MKSLLNLWRRLNGWGFELLYNQMAWSYDAVSWIVSLGQWRDWQAAALPFVAGPRVLEVAFGTGHMLAALTKGGKRVVGIDLSPSMVRLTRRPTHGLPVPLVRGRAQALPFAAASFDSVLSTFPASFIVEAQTLAAVWHCLVPDGVLVIVPDAVLAGSGVLTKLIDWLYVITGQRASADTASTPQSFWIQRLELAGFSAEYHTITLPHSVVTVIVAHKSADSPVLPVR